MTTTTTTSASAEAAIQHLKRIKPLDGWAIETKSHGGIRLLRRNVPVMENFFLDLYHDVGASGTVVGILSAGAGATAARGQVLVDAKGQPTKQVQIISIPSWSPPASTSRSRSVKSNNNNSSTTTTTNSLSDEQNKELLTYAAYVISGAILLRILFQTVFVLYILALPLAYMYLLQNCPSEASFDAKKEIKRILRGQHLPEGDPNKPKGFLNEALARINATVTTELATGLGYEVSMINLAGAAIVSTVTVPSAKFKGYWVGAAGKWTYIYSQQLED